MKTKNNNRKKSFKIKFYGETTVREYTENSARAMVESLENIKSDRPVRTENTWHWIKKGIIINIPSIMTTVFMMGMIMSWGKLLDKVNSLPEELQLIYLIVLVMFIFVSMRIPKTIGGWYSFNKY